MSTRSVPMITAALAACLAVASPASAQPSAFRATLDAHLAAIQNRDLAALIPTLTERPELTLIMPTGDKLDTRQQFIDLHRDWFADKDAGQWQGEVVQVVEASDQAVALIRYRYGPRGAKEVSVSWLTLTFARDGGRWGLVFDQNTRIRTESAAP
jgi:ketosteroid isomerase-like protein